MVIIIGIYSLIYGGLSSFDTFMESFAYIKFCEKMQVTYWNSIFGTLLLSLSLFLCLFAGGIAFLLRKRWGKILVQISLIIQVFYFIYLIIPACRHWFTLDEYHKYTFFKPFYTSTSSFLIYTLLDLILKITILYFITRPKIKEWLKEA